MRYDDPTEPVARVIAAIFGVPLIVIDAAQHPDVVAAAVDEVMGR